MKVKNLLPVLAVLFYLSSAALAYTPTHTDGIGEIEEVVGDLMVETGSGMVDDAAEAGTTIMTWIRLSLIVAVIGAIVLGIKKVKSAGK